MISGAPVLVWLITAAAASGCQARTLPTCSEPQLLWLLTTPGVNQQGVDDSAVRDELGHRVSASPAILRQVLDAFGKPVDLVQRDELVDVLYGHSEPSVARAFKKRLSAQRSKASCRIAAYLGHRGDSRALAILNENFWSCPLSSLEWSYVVSAFSDWRYYPATENLIEALDAASLNLAGGALDALKVLYPGATAKDLATPEAAKRYFEAQARSGSGGRPTR
jgi:hypothetical protein